MKSGATNPLSLPSVQNWWCQINKRQCYLKCAELWSFGCQDYSEMFFGISLDGGSKVITEVQWDLKQDASACCSETLDCDSLLRQCVHMGMLTLCLPLCLLSVLLVLLHTIVTQLHIQRAACAVCA